MFYFHPEKLIRFTYGTLLIFVFHSFTALAQMNNRIQSHASFAEKIYLQLDSRIYTTDQTIWFKAIVAGAVDHVRNNSSGVLYVELINPEKQIVEKKIVKLTKGIGDNFFDLFENYKEGRYLVRAYTQWNKNFDPDFIFTTYINVFSSSRNRNKEAITDITILKDDTEESTLRARLNPLALDSLHNKQLEVSLSVSGKENSFSVNRNNDGHYILHYALPIDAGFVTIEMETENGTRTSTTVTLNEDLLDVQFFPESGEMVHGLVSKIGFKVLNYSGKGVPVEGVILNKEGTAMTSFKSNTLGMGSFYIQPDSSTTYYARLDSPSEEGVSMKIPLPKVHRKGNILSITKRNDEIRLLASSNYFETDSVYIQVNSRGIAYYLLEGRLKGGHLKTTFSVDALPEGIISFTMLDNNKLPVAERLYFNERPESRLNQKINIDKGIYAPREKTVLHIGVTESGGQQVKANLSVLVIEKQGKEKFQEKRENILSYFLLSSELRGEIEDPGYYFRKRNKNRFNGLDALMLTQGWRKYHYKKPVQDTFQFKPEPILSVKGTVGGVFSKDRKKEGIDLTLMTFGDSRSIFTQATDSLGRFNFDINNEYGENLDILIQSANSRGNNKDFTISLDEKEPPEIVYDHVPPIEKVDSIIHRIVQKQQERKMVEDSFEFSLGINELDEVVLDGYKMTPERERVIKRYGKPDVVIQGKAIQEKEKNWSYGLYSVLLFEFPEDIRIKRKELLVPRGLTRPHQIDKGTYLHAEIVGGGPTLVVVDGIPVEEINLDMIPSIPPSEVRSVELIKFANIFSELYMDVYPRVHPTQVPVTGSVIAIYSHGGQGIYGTKKPKGVLQTSITAFSPEREFYAPKYDTPSEDSSKPDLRSLIHWEPRVEIDSNGNASVGFYNADSTGEILVVVEAISEDGGIGYEEIIYEVKEK